MRATRTQRTSRRRRDRALPPASRAPERSLGAEQPTRRPPRSTRDPRVGASAGRTPYSPPRRPCGVTELTFEPCCPPTTSCPPSLTQAQRRAPTSSTLLPFGCNLRRAGVSRRTRRHPLETPSETCSVHSRSPAPGGSSRTRRSLGKGAAMKTVLVHERPTSGAKQSRPAQRRPNLAARVGRWSAAHWKTATFGWLALVLSPSRSAARSARSRPTRPRRAPASRAAWTGSSMPGSRCPRVRAC